MSKSVAPARFPVPLRGTLPSEADMLKELEALKGAYGGINERMREWLMRGLQELKNRTQQVPSPDGDATRALVAVATELTNSVAISQHLLAMYAQAKETLAASSASQTRVSVAAARGNADPASPTAKGVVKEPAAPAAGEASPEGAEPSATSRWGYLKGLAGG